MNDIKRNLLELQNGKCANCGKIVDNPVNATIEHILPVAAGGSRGIENLVLTCRECNYFLSNNIKGYEFEQYVYEIIKNSKKFARVLRDYKIGNHYIADILVQQLENDKQVETIIEIKFNTSLTVDRINQIIDRFNKARELKKNSSFVLLIPGKLSDDSTKLLKEQNIDIWDSDYLYKEFSQQIEALEHPFFQKLISPPETKKVEYEFIERLRNCIPGKDQWIVYQKLIGEILEYLLCPPLRSPLQENSDFFSVNRRDFILPNYSETGFWSYLSNRYLADYIVIDAKNYTKGITKKEVLQMANYLKPHGTGLFGIIITRSGTSKNTIHTLREVWALEKKLIIVLDDHDLEQMLLEKLSNKEPEAVLRQKIEDFRLSL